MKTDPVKQERSVLGLAPLANSAQSTGKFLPTPSAMCAVL